MNLRPRDYEYSGLDSKLVLLWINQRYSAKALGRMTLYCCPVYIACLEQEVISRAPAVSWKIRQSKYKGKMMSRSASLRHLNFYTMQRNLLKASSLQTYLTHSSHLGTGTVLEHMTRLERDRVAFHRLRKIPRVD